jgi:glutamate carboxypeptidase
LQEGMPVNPGPISGGTRPNVVAERAQGEFDLRAWSVSDLNELVDAFRETAARAVIPGVEVEILAAPGAGMPAMERTEGTIRLESRAIEIASELGFPLKGAKTGGGSDVSFACHKGTPGLDGLGPVGGLDHGPDEYILLSSIVPRTALLAKLLVAIGEDPDLRQARG